MVSPSRQLDSSQNKNNACKTLENYALDVEPQLTSTSHFIVSSPHDRIEQNG